MALGEIKTKQELYDAYNDLEYHRDGVIQEAHERFSQQLLGLMQVAIKSGIVESGEHLPWQMHNDGEYQWQKDGLVQRLP